MLYTAGESLLFIFKCGGNNILTSTITWTMTTVLGPFQVKDRAGKMRSQARSRVKPRAFTSEAKALSTELSDSSID